MHSGLNMPQNVSRQVVNNGTVPAPDFNTLAFDRPSIQRTKSPDLLRRGHMAKGGGGILTNYHTYSNGNQNQQSSLLNQPIFKSLKDARLERKLSKQRTTNEANTFIDFRTVRD